MAPAPVCSTPDRRSADTSCELDPLSLPWRGSRDAHTLRDHAAFQYRCSAGLNCLMAPLSRRRLHGSIVAQIDWNAVASAWGGRVWREPDATSASRLYRLFDSVTSAQAAADHAVRRRFKHRCDVTTCGVWLPHWTEERSIAASPEDRDAALP